jgi:hypothetical protein
MTRQELVARWTSRQQEYERVGAQVDGVKICGDILADLEAVFTSEDSELVPLAQAADLSGYSKDRLRKMAKLGLLLHEKRKRRLYFPKGSLPKKARKIDAPKASGYDPVADARRVATLPKESHHG